MIAALGVDGGQSGIRLRHSSGPAVVEVEGVSRVEGDTIGDVADAVARGWERGAFPPADRVVLGLTTAPADALGRDRLGQLVGGSTRATEVWVMDDAVTSHAGALSGQPGINLAVGTGVACLAVPEVGAPRIIGGHGYLLGDEGGAFWIGRHGLTAVLRAREGRGPETTLTVASERRFGGLADLHVRLHDADRPINEIAQFAPDVIAAAEGTDAAADSIVHAAASELLGVVRAAAEWVGGDEVALVLGGRLLDRQGLLRRRLEALLAREALPVVARTGDGSALDGAIMLGLSSGPGRYADLVGTWSRETVG